MAEKMKSAEAAAPLIDNGDVKKLLSLLSKVEGDLHNTVTDAKATIAKVEAVGEELRSVGGHLKQAGRGPPFPGGGPHGRPGPTGAAAAHRVLSENEPGGRERHGQPTGGVFFFQRV